MSLHKRILDTHCSVAITNADGTITYVNNKFCELSGYSKDELLGANHRTLISYYHDRKFYENMYQTITMGNIWKGIFVIKRKTATYIGLIPVSFPKWIRLAILLNTTQYALTLLLENS